jgi:hypothetical protein
MAKKRRLTEKGWRACTDDLQSLEFLQGQASDRKLRLSAVACSCGRKAP